MLFRLFCVDLGLPDNPAHTNISFYRKINKFTARTSHRKAQTDLCVPPPSAGQTVQSVIFVTIFVFVYSVFVCLWTVAPTRAESPPFSPVPLEKGQGRGPPQRTPGCKVGKNPTPPPGKRQGSRNSALYPSMFVLVAQCVWFWSTHTFLWLCSFCRLVHRTGEVGACERPKTQTVNRTHVPHKL